MAELIQPGTLKGSRSPRDELRAAKLRYAPRVPTYDH